MTDYDYAIDDDDLESAFEDLDYDEARRRRRRRRPGRRPSRLTVPPVSRGSGDFSRTRDRQLARAINVTSEDVTDVDLRLQKVNSDVARLRQISLISLLLPRRLDVTKDELNDVGSPPRDVKVVTDVTSPTDIVPLVLFTTLARGIGSAPGGAAATAGDSSAILPLALVLLNKDQAQFGTSTSSTSTGGLDQTTLLVLLLALGGLS